MFAMVSPLKPPGLAAGAGIAVGVQFMVSHLRWRLSTVINVVCASADRTKEMERRLECFRCDGATPLVSTYLSAQEREQKSQ